MFWNKNFLFKRGIFTGFIVVVIVFLTIVSSLSLAQGGAKDDLSYLRASALLSTNSQAFSDLKNDLAKDSASLSETQSSRYLIRYQVSHYYLFSNSVVRIFEKFSTQSPYQSIIFSLLSSQILAIIVLLLTLRIFLKKESEVVLASLLFGIFPSIFCLTKIFPFSSLNYNWSSGYARNSIILIYLAILIIISSLPKWPNKKPWLLVGLFSALTFSLNFPFVLVVALPLLLYMILRKIFPLFVDIDFLDLNKKKIAYLAIASIVLLTIVKGFLIFGFFKQIELVKIMEIAPIFWLSCGLFLGQQWIKYRVENRQNDSPLLVFCDFIFPFFIICGSLSVGLQIFSQPDNYLSGGSFFASFFEFSNRILSISQLLFWCLFSSLVYFWLKDKIGWWRKIIILISFLLVYNFAFNFAIYVSKNLPTIFDKKMLNASWEELKLKPISEKYGNEILFYQSLANSLKNNTLIFNNDKKN